MKQVQYGEDSVSIRFDFPSEWDPVNLSALTLTVKNDAGTELLAEDAMTLYTATSLLEDADQYTSSIVLATGAGSLEAGDLMWIDGASGGEIVRIKSYVAATRTAELEDILQYDHSADDGVYATWATYALDVSDTTTFPKGLTTVFIFTPTGTGQVTRDEYQISHAVVDVSGLEGTFKIIYPRAYHAFTSPANNFDIYRAEAERQIKNELLSQNNAFDYDRIVDQDMIAPVVMAKMALLWTLNGDVEKEDERKVLSADYASQMAYLLNRTKWTDDDQDDAKDEEEISDNEPIFNTSW